MLLPVYAHFVYTWSGYQKKVHPHIYVIKFCCTPISGSENIGLTNSQHSFEPSLQPWPGAGQSNLFSQNTPAYDSAKGSAVQYNAIDAG